MRTSSPDFNSLCLQQPVLDLHKPALAVTREPPRTVLRHDTVARHYNRHGISPASIADSPGTGPQAFCQGPVSHYFTGRNQPQRTPDLALKYRTRQLNIDFRILIWIVEIAKNRLLHPPGLGTGSLSQRISAGQKFQLDERFALYTDSQPAYRRNKYRIESDLVSHAQLPLRFELLTRCRR